MPLKQLWTSDPRRNENFGTQRHTLPCPLSSGANTLPIGPSPPNLPAPSTRPDHTTGPARTSLPDLQGHPSSLHTPMHENLSNRLPNTYSWHQIAKITRTNDKKGHVPTSAYSFPRRHGPGSRYPLTLLRPNRVTCAQQERGVAILFCKACACELVFGVAPCRMQGRSGFV